MSHAPTRILIVDDSALYRQAIRNVLSAMPDVTIVGVAKDGVEALKRIEELDPDLLTLDVQMPAMDGIEVLRQINRRRLRARAIMVSALTSEGAQATTDALLEGAFDFILKPSSSDPREARKRLRQAMADKLAAFHNTEGTTHGEKWLVGQPSATPKTGCRVVVLSTLR